jgi:hypothetical protein
MQDPTDVGETSPWVVVPTRAFTHPAFMRPV